MDTHKQKSPEQQELSILPIAYGNEEETGMLIDKGYGFNEPYDLIGKLDHYIPEELRGYESYLTNGFRIYPGDTYEYDPLGRLTNLERATPECSSVDELLPRIRASELLAISIAESYARSKSAETNDTVNVRLHRRVVDSVGNRKGCHDNFAVDADAIDARSSEIKSDGIFLNNAVLGHLATRSLVTGAGHVDISGLRYAQKIEGLTETRGYAYFGTMYRSASEEGTPRLEIRCNDINISEWATRMRIGSAALAIAISATPLRDELPQLARHSEYYEEARQYNTLDLKPDGSILASENIKKSLAFQKQLAELTLFELEQYSGKLPDKHYEVAEELLFYCNDFEKIISDEAHIGILADRADWAAKFVQIQREVNEDEAMGFRRSILDIKSQARDLRYDHIAISAVKGRLSRNKYGNGYKLRDSNTLRGTTNQREVQHAYLHAPSTTRAGRRAELLKRYQDDVVSCTWTHVRYQSQDRSESIIMPNVVDNDLQND